MNPSSDECGALVRAISTLQRALSVQVSPRMILDHGIDLRLFILLKRIHSGSVYPGELASDTLEGPSQISRQLDKLEKLGFIERSLDSADSRRTRLALTGRATILLDEVEAAFAAMVGPALMQLPPERRRALIADMEALGQALQPQARR